MIVLSKCPLLANTTLRKDFLLHYKNIKISIIKIALCIVVLLSEFPIPFFFFIYIYIYIGFSLYHVMYYEYIVIINIVYSIVKVEIKNTSNITILLAKV